MKTNRQKRIFSTNQITPGIQVKGAKPKGGSQPPRNRMVVIPLIRIMLAYSPRKNSAYVMDEYSTMKPPVISDSPSGRSNGARLVSASAEMKKITNIGNSGIANQMVCCALTMSEMLSEPTQSSTEIMTKPIETS